MFALVDCNNFYASCERVFRPDLNGKPVVVLSNNDGCVIARSNESKALNIPMGAPFFKYKSTFEANNVSVFSSNYPLYADMSKRVMTLLATFAPEIEIYSIDEAFLKFENTQGIDFDELGKEIVRTITKSTGIPVSVGFANTKSLSKVANRIAKKFNKRTAGTYLIATEEQRIKALKWLKVADVWGIGRKHSKRLNDLGIITAFQFTKQSDEWVRSNMSVIGLRLKKDLEGKPTLALEQTKPKKSIATTRSFDKNILAFEPIAERVATFAVSCAEKLRKQQSNCAVMLVFLHSNPYRKDLPQYRKKTVIQLPFPSNSSIELAKFAKEGLQRIYKKGYHYKKAGVVVMEITPENEKQLSLFENSNPKHKPLMEVVDKINNALGHQKIKLGSQDLTKTWKMRQELLSPRYTTNLDDIITVKV